MKKILLGTSALIALGFAAPAAAQPELDITGSVTTYFGYVSEEAATERNFDAATFGTLKLEAKGKHDETSLEYGAVITLDEFSAAGAADADDAQDDVLDIEGTYVYIDSPAWGRVDAGDVAPAEPLTPVAPTGPDAPDAPGEVGPDYDLFVIGNVPTIDALGSARDDLEARTAWDDASRGTTFKYTTDDADFGGLKAGVSMTPSDKKGYALDRDAASTFENLLVATAQYAGAAAAFAYKAGATYISTDAENFWSLGADATFGAFTAGVYYDDFNTDAGADNNWLEVGVKYDANNLVVGAYYGFEPGEDARLLNVGATYTFGAIVVGADWWTDLEDGQAFDVGAKYTMDAWVFGASYEWGDDSAGVEDGMLAVGVEWNAEPLKVGAIYEMNTEDDDRLAQVGFEYKMAPGLDVNGKAAYFNEEAGNDGFSVLLGTKVTF